MNNDHHYVVTDALAYYDKKMQELGDKIGPIAFSEPYVVNRDTDKAENREHKVILYDANKKEIANSKYEILGTYYPLTQLLDKEKKEEYDFTLHGGYWVWGWGNASMIEPSNVSKKLAAYAMDLPPSSLIKHILVSSRLEIKHKLELEIIIALAMFLAKIDITICVPNTWAMDGSLIKQQFIPNYSAIDYYIFV